MLTLKCLWSCGNWKTSGSINHKSKIAIYSWMLNVPPQFYKHTVCAQHGASIFLLKYTQKIYSEYPEGANPLLASLWRQLASCQLVWGDPCSEGSRTAKPWTDEQKLHKRQWIVGEQAHLCKAPDQQTIRCRCSRIRRKDKRLTWGDLPISCT